MGILIVPLLIYPVWGIPALVIFNFLFTRHLYLTHSALQSGSIALAVSFLIFAPLSIPSQSFFGSIFAPWYIAPFLTPPSVEFSFIGVFVTFIVAITSIALTLFFKGFKF